MDAQTFSCTIAALLVLGSFSGAGAAQSSEALDQLFGEAGLDSGAKIPVSPVNAPDMVDDETNKSAAATELPANVSAFLSVIAHAELKGCTQFRKGSTKGYNIAFGCRPIRSYDEHPGVIRGHSAAGRYQFLVKTWRKLGLGAFTPANQDKGAVKLIQGSRAYGLVMNASNKTSFVAAVRRLRGVWPSLAGGSQQQTSMDELWRVFRRSQALKD
jgi:muramidase (phage lysozyme)